MLAVIGFLLVVAFVVLIVMYAVTRKKNQNRSFKLFLAGWGCFILGMVLIFSSPNEPATTKQEASQPSTETKVAEASTDQAPATEKKTETVAEKAPAAETKKESTEPTEAEWQESYKEILLNETQSYIELSVRGTLSKDRFDSAVGVLEKYAPRVAPDQQEAFKNLADMVKANDLDSAKRQFKYLGGEDFEELNKNADAVSFN
ncbi:hypothetical protein [Paenibacillus wenxiniae]|uniref:Host cell surface-exposed lipoprotein n=1 Tax=Paenibacillus wenxiniae TaxID=1636843 RepID=A0ABW4RM77_9BACL